MIKRGTVISIIVLFVLIIAVVLKISNSSQVSGNDIKEEAGREETVTDGVPNTPESDDKEFDNIEGKETDGAVNITETDSEGQNAETDGEGQDSSGIDTDEWYNLPGYINGVQGDEQQKVCNIELPYYIQDTPIVIEGIGQYTGPFVEDGSDEPTANVLAIVIKNNSDTVIEFAELTFRVNSTESAVFQMSTIPAGKSAVVLEKDAREYRADDRMDFGDKLYAKKDSLSLMEDRVAVSAEEGVLTVTNLTQENLGTVYVRYKTRINDQYYLGGITYSCRVENVDAGQTADKETRHFNTGESQILMVEAIQE